MITVPLWVAIVVGLLAAWSFLSRLLLPSVRWVWSRRINRLSARINRTLALKIPPIAMTKREVLIDRLVYDPRVMREVALYCEREGVPHAVALRKVEEYAREIVPAFSAYVYFRIGTALAKRLASLLYRVRLGHADFRGLRNVAEGASVVFVMNHRSNMDYMLVAHLISRRVAVSYAVGEWAKVWPLQQIIRAMGAYFVRRNSGDALYRRVLECYVRMAVEGGAVQAIFPEGKLSRDGTLGKPKIGLFDYMIRHFDPAGERDIVFVPVALNYDRVLEDRTLLLDVDGKDERRSGLAAMHQTMLFLLSQVQLRLRRKWYRFGYACANFGSPISLREYLARAGWRPQDLDAEERGRKVIALATELMQCVGRLVPVLPVSVICKLFVDDPQAALTEEEISTAVQRLHRQYESLGAHVYVPRGEAEYSVLVGLRMLRLRRFVIEESGRYRLNPQNEAAVRYYANAISHLTCGDGLSDLPGHKTRNLRPTDRQE
jgi:glycerol-3-phosphate O-acyltransferase